MSEPSTPTIRREVAADWQAEGIRKKPRRDKGKPRPGRRWRVVKKIWRLILELP